MKTTTVAKIENFDDIGVVLSEETEKLRNGKSTIQQAKAVANLVGKMIAASRVLLEFTRLTGEKPSCNFLQLFGAGIDPAPRNGKRSGAFG